jgi:Flp pilus assembly protein TadD
MPTVQSGPAATTAAGFRPIPSRIRDLPAQPGVAAADPATRAAIEQSLHDLAQRLAIVHRTAAEAWLSQERSADALRHLEAAAEFAPDRLENWNQLGYVRYLAGDDAGAIAAFERVLTADPKQADAWFNLGMVQFGRGELAAAELSFRRSLEIDGKNAEAWNNRGVCLFQSGHRDEARVCFQNALTLDPTNEDAKANLLAS